MQGQASNLPQVAGWLQALAAQKSYTDPYLTTTQGSRHGLCLRQLHVHLVGGDLGPSPVAPVRQGGQLT